MTGRSRNYVLLHGAWHGAWCWDDVADRLRAQGHHVSTAELPARDDAAAVGAVSMPAATERVVQAVKSAPGPVVLVAHSMGGVVATQAAEEVSGDLEALVYVAAFVPPNGKSLIDLATSPAFEADSLVPVHVQYDFETGTCTVPPAHAHEVFYNTSGGPAAAAAAARLNTETLQVQAAPMSVSEEKWGSVPRYYVETLQDHALPIAFQREIQEEIGFTGVVTMDTDHSPFLSSPAEFANILVGLGA